MTRSSGELAHFLIQVDFVEVCKRSGVFFSLQHGLLALLYAAEQFRPNSTEFVPANRRKAPHFYFLTVFSWECLKKMPFELNKRHLFIK